MDVSAVLVTRGDVDLREIIDSITASGIEDVIVWNNDGWGAVRQKRIVGDLPWGIDILHPIPIGERHPDLAVYGRYAAIEHARGDLIYVQDDDCVLPPESIQALIDRWEELAEGGVTDVLVANQPAAFRHDFYSVHCLVGFGAVFQRDLPSKTFSRFGSMWPLVGEEDFFDRTCDIVFTALTPRVLMDLPYENLPWAEDETRMFKQNGHVEERARMLELVRQVRDA